MCTLDMLVAPTGRVEPQSSIPLLGLSSCPGVAVDEIRDRLTPEERAQLEAISWRDSELDEFPEDAVKDLGRHVI